MNGVDTSAASIEAAARASREVGGGQTPPRTSSRSGGAASPTRRVPTSAHMSPPSMLHEMLAPIRVLGLRIGWKFKDPKLERAYAYRTLCDMWFVEVLMLVFLIVFRIARIVSIIITGLSELAVFILSGLVVANYLLLLVALFAFRALGLHKAPQAVRGVAGGTPRPRDSDSSPAENVLLLGESPMDAEAMESPELSANLPPTPATSETQRLLGISPSTQAGLGGSDARAPPSPPSEVTSTVTASVAPVAVDPSAAAATTMAGEAAPSSGAAPEAFQVVTQANEPQRRYVPHHSRLASFLLWYMTQSLYFSLHWGLTVILGLFTQFLADWSTCDPTKGSVGVTCFAYSHAIFPVIPVSTCILLMFFCAITFTHGPIGLVTICCLIILLAIHWATLYRTSDPLVPEVSSLVVDIVQVTLLTATCFIIAVVLLFSIDTSRRKRLVYLAAINAQFARYRLEVARTAAFEAELNRLREEEVVASTASAVQEMTIGYASHQLRNPLHAAKVLLSELEESTTLSPHSRSNFAELSHAIDQLRRITDDVLQHQRLLGGAAAVRPSRTLIRELLSTVVQSYANTSGRPIMLAVEEDVPTTVSIDGLRLTQAVSNGLSNAVAALPWWATTGNRIMVLVRIMGAPPLVSTMRRPAVVIEGRDKAAPALAWIDELGPSGAQLVVPQPGRGAGAAAPAAGHDRPSAAADEATRTRSQPAIATYNPAYQARLCDPGWSKLVDRATALAKLQRHQAKAARAAALARGQADPLVQLLHHIRNSITSQARLTVRYLSSPLLGPSLRAIPEAGEPIYEPRGAGEEEESGGAGGNGGFTSLLLPGAASAAGPTLTPSVPSDAGGGVTALPLPEPSQPSTATGEAPRWQWWLRVEVINETQGKTPLAGKNVAELFNPFSLGGPIHDASAARIAHTGLGLPICTLLAASLSGRTGLFDDTAFPVDLFEEEMHPRWAQLLPSTGSTAAASPRQVGAPGPSGGLPSLYVAPSPTQSVSSVVTAVSSPLGPSPLLAPSNPSEAPASPPAVEGSMSAAAWGREMLPPVQPLQPHRFTGATTTVTRFFFAVPLQLPLVTASEDELLEAADWFDPAPLTGIDVFTNPTLGEELNLPLGITNAVTRHWMAPRKAGGGASKGHAYRPWHGSHRKESSTGSSAGTAGLSTAAVRLETPRASPTAPSGIPTRTPGGGLSTREPVVSEAGQPSRSPLALPSPALQIDTSAPSPAPAAPTLAGTGITAAAAPHETTAPTPSRPPTAAPARRFRALVVDDEETNRRINARLMTRLGAEVETGRDGDEVPALWEAATAAGHDPPFDVVCLDVIMRRVHGTECAQWLRREKGYHGPIIAATGNATEADQKAYRDMGFTDVLVKPFSLQDLRASLRDCGVLAGTT